MTAPTFAIIGAAGYIAPRHGAAIKAVGGRLVAACDVHDSVGWLDRDWPECEFILGADGDMPPADYCVICVPNTDHMPEVAAALLVGDVICEKPLTLTVADLDILANREQESGHHVYTVLNLRHHPEIRRAKRMAEEDRPARVAVTYHAPRGPWYDVSWKGDPTRSGGIVFNVGIHIFDTILRMFGPAEVTRANAFAPHSICIDLVHNHALYPDTFVRVNLSTDPKSGAVRLITFDGGRAEFDLKLPFSIAEGNGHTACYREILAGRGPGIEEARSSIEFCERINANLGVGV